MKSTLTSGLWFIGLWVAGVVSVGMIALIFHLLMFGV